MKLPPGVVVLFTCALFTGCAHGFVDELPTAPSPAAPTIRSLTITPTGGGTFFIGVSVEITASGPYPESGGALGALAVYTDGSRTFVPATWSSSDTNVVVIQDSRMTAVGSGTAIVTASAGGLTATETFLVAPGIAGNWSGSYVVDRCDAGSGPMHALICAPASGSRPAGILTAGTAAPVSLAIAQNGTALTAPTRFGAFAGTLTGTDRGANFLTLLGTLTAADVGTIAIVHWDARVQADAMEGFIGFEVRVPGVPSHALVTAHFDTVTRR